MIGGVSVESEMSVVLPSLAGGEQISGELS